MMKFKKILITVGVCVIGSLSFTGIKADTVPFKTKGQQSVPGVTVVPFNVGSNSIQVKLEPHGYVYTSVNGEKIKVADKEFKLKCTYTDKQIYSDCQDREWKVSGNRADGSGNYTVQLEKSLTEEDIVTLSFADDGNFYFGKLVYESEKKQAEHFQKEQEAKEKEYAEGLFKRSIEEENNKTWRDTVRDSFQDTWWNLKSWWSN
ncbi:hypothetical protein [Streptococcus ruminantium]|uniref:hypothetical protein n=1 Tax=Streptococcus ruminantium TaxID=1917441 RepID=UPI001D1413DD|nr:hypothetical protein [Streptococcus ruminantium]